MPTVANGPLGGMVILSPFRSPNANFSSGASVSLSRLEMAYFGPVKQFLQLLRSPVSDLSASNEHF